jgi:hypothetical protein
VTAPSSTLAYTPATVASDVHETGTGARRLGHFTPLPLRSGTRMTLAGGIVTLAGSILIALAVPLLVVGLPVVLLARLVLTIVWARSR